VEHRLQELLVGDPIYHFGSDAGVAHLSTASIWLNLLLGPLRNSQAASDKETPRSPYPYQKECRASKNGSVRQTSLEPSSGQVVKVL
jgi:hypothetical protein